MSYTEPNPPAIVCVRGSFGSGKDTIANILVEDFGYVRMAFGDFLKGEVQYHLLNAEFPKGLDPESKTGQAFLTCLALGQLDPFLKPTSPEMRNLLQLWGSEFRRSEDENYWVFKLDQVAGPLLTAGVRIVISDCRFLNESVYAWKRDGEVWEADRRTEVYAYEGEQKRHQSENSLWNVPANFKIDNNGSILDLTMLVRIYMKHNFNVHIPQPKFQFA